ncbi:MAG: methyltransferase [Verrucomicrobiota bacterium]
MANQLPSWWFLKTGINAILVGILVVFSWNQALNTPAALAYIAQAVVVIGAVINLAHYRILKRAAPHLGDPEELATCGGFLRWIRHPMYLGELIFVFGLALLIYSPLALILTAVYLYAIIRLTAAEDQQMAARFGHEHAAWSNKTHALLPGIW